MKRSVAGLVVLVFLAGPVVGAGYATPTANETASPTATPTVTPTQVPSATPTATPAATAGGPPAANAGSGEYSLNELRRGGQSDPNAPPSVRYVYSNGVRAGAVSIRYQPARPTANSWQFLEPSTTLHTDEVQVYSTVFGSAGRNTEYELHVVFYQVGEREITTANGTETVPAATNQTERRYTIRPATGYDTTNVTFPSHFDQTWHASMWLTQGGDRVDGARWTFDHRSDPGGREVDIATETDAWSFTAKNAVIPGGIGLVIGLLLSRGTLRRTGRGPDIGGVLWGLGAIAFAFIVASVGYFQAAVILDNAPWVMGALFVVVGYGGGFLFSNPVRRIGFERQEIFDAKSLPGFEQMDKPDEDVLADGGTAVDSDMGFIATDEYKEELYRDLPEKRAVRTEEGFRVPVKGIRPFLARLFADGARLDLSSFRTRIIVREGRLDEVIAVDPEAEEPVTHIPARLRRALPWDDLPRDEETGEITADWREQLTAGALTGGVVCGPLAIGWMLFAGAGIPVVGALLGLIVTATLAYTAEDGTIEFDEAPIHDNPARTTVTHMQVDHKDAKDISQAKEREYRERAKNSRQAREERQHEKRSVTDEVLNALVGESPADSATENGHPSPNGDGGGHDTEDGDSDAE